MRSFVRVSLFLVSGFAAVGASAQTPISLTVSGNEAVGSIDLPGGLRADLSISFENAVGLTPTALDVTARVVSPLDSELLARLPADTTGGLLGGLLRLVTIPGALPVLIAIEPSAASALSFSGVVHVGLHTYNLHLTPVIPLALYKAAAGQPFYDITISEATGSYRVCGSGGDFSEFLIVVDTRPIDEIITGKFDALQAQLDAGAGSMPALVAAELQQQLSNARSLFETGATLPAIAAVSSLSQYVRDHSGAEIPDVWRAHDATHVNVAGRLRSAADTLRFSLIRKSNN
ncbi:MAG: DUF6689 family protein [Vicinamibacteria bacterium]